MLWKGAIKDVLPLLFIVMSRHSKVQFFAEGKSRLHPDLAQRIIALSFETVVKLLGMLLERVRQAKPFDCQQEHPIDRLLKELVSLSGLIQSAHPLLAVAQVERFFFIYLDQRALPGTKGGALIDIAE